MFRSIFLTVLITVAAFSIVTYTACSKDDCKGVSCQNGGTCKDGICICTSDYTGKNCETPAEPCTKIKCKNEGVCVDSKCKCPVGFEGELCEQLTINKYFGAWTGTDSCASGDYPDVNITIGYSSASNKSIVVTNPGGIGEAYSVTGELSSENTVTIPQQIVAAGINMSGKIEFTGSNAMKFSYTRSGTINDTCTGTYSK